MTTIEARLRGCSFPKNLNALAFHVITPCVNKLLPLAVLLLLPSLSTAAQPASEPSSSAAPASVLPAGLESWGKALLSQTEPQAYFSHMFDNGEALTEVELGECREAREGAMQAVAAAGELYHARLELCRKLLALPWMSDEDKPSDDVLAACRLLIEDGFRRDLWGLACRTGWPELAALELPKQPGRQLLRHLPAPYSLAYLNMRGCTAEITHNSFVLVEQWEQMQEHFLACYANSFGDGDEENAFCQDRSPFTGHPRPDSWSGADESCRAQVRQYRAELQALFVREKAAWKAYSEAMQALACPSISYSGSGVGIRMADVQRHLLDSRTRFLCLLAAGTERDGLHNLATWHETALLELHPEHPYGEIFSAEAHIFRHPGLDGQPWCIRFPWVDAGFIPVKDGAALQDYLRTASRGGKAEVRGYQSLESSNTPYVAKDEPAGAHTPHQRPEGGFTVQQVFILLEAQATKPGRE